MNKSGVIPKNDAEMLLGRKQITGIIISLQLTLLLAALDQTVVTTAMPKIVARLDGFDRYALVTTAYLLTSTVAVPVFGSLSDIFGRRRIFLSTAALFVVASILCGLAGIYQPINLAGFDGMNQLILARALQGLAAGAILSLSFTVIGDVFPAAERGKYQGYFAAVFALASIIGPTLGGYISESLGWRYVFYLNVPIGLLSMLIFHLAFPEFISIKQKHDVDYVGVLLLITWLTPLLLALTWVVKVGWMAPEVLGSLILSMIVFLLFLRVELNTAQALIPLRLFCHPVISISCFSVFVSGVGMFGSILLIPLFLQSVLGISAVMSGAFLTPLILTVAGGSVLSGQLVARNGKYKKITLWGFSAMLVGVFFLSRMDMHTPIAVILSNMLLAGIGMGLLLPIYTIVIQSVVPYELLGISTGLSQFFRSLGGTIGTSIFGSIMLFEYQSQLAKVLPINLPAAASRIIDNPIELFKMQAALTVLIKQSLVKDVFSAIKQSLVYSIDGVFFIYSIILGLTLLLNWTLTEVPLRKTTGRSSFQ